MRPSSLSWLERSPKRASSAFAALLGGSLLGGALLASPSLAFGQAKAPANAQEAERLGKEGERLLAAHDAAGAIDPLARAYNMTANPRFLLPLGLAYAEAERPLDALDALGRYLKDAPAVPDAKRKEIGTRFAVMLDQVGALVTVEASRQNAPVKVDGRPVGMTPLAAPLRLMPGKHEIHMQPAATDPSSGAKVQIEVRPGERRTVKLEPGTASKFLEPQAQLDAGSGQPSTDVTSARPSAPTPITKQRWFWPVVGGGAAAVAALSIGLGAGLASRKSTSGLPTEEFPNLPNWPGGPIDARPAVFVAGLGR
ncbi:MAG: PEGA domain-containing protein [Myxococcales bacterium]|nr:PEGA domain-containing protein [Myxococcales bacterium]